VGNVSMAAATCLTLLAGAVQDSIVPVVIPFIESHIKSIDWHQREAAIMTFGSTLEGPFPAVLRPLASKHSCPSSTQLSKLMKTPSFALSLLASSATSLALLANRVHNILPTS